MGPRFPLRWCLPPLLVGIVVGIGLDSIRWGRPAQAKSDAMKPASAAIVDPDRIPSPLIEASRNLARVAAEVTPSVVHIESKLEKPDRGMVEETGSGVIVASPRVPGYYVVTNRHVIGDAAEHFEQISIRLPDG